MRRRLDRKTVRGIAALTAVVALLIPSAVGAAGDTGSSDPALTGAGQPETPPLLDRRLAELAVTPHRALPDGPRVHGFDPRTDRVLVEIRAVEERGGEVEAAAGTFGATRVGRLGDFVLAEVPVPSLMGLARHPAVAWVGVAPIPIADGTGEGVATVAADAWHTTGHTGSGIKVAIIDVGFAGFENRLGTELPAKVHTFDQCGDIGSSNHGTAVAEVVHETAPHATLYLMCIEDGEHLLEAVVEAIIQGVTVINHSVTWAGSARGDGSGFVGELAEFARDHGILWVNSSGNQALTHWGGTFVPGDDEAWNEFAVGDQTIEFTIPVGTAFEVFLRWDDWPASSNNYDLYLFAGAPGDPMPTGPAAGVARSRDPQTGSQPPEEFLDYQNPGPGTTFHLAIHRASAAATPEMDLFVRGVPAEQQPIQHHVPARSILDPATSPHVVAVGAFCVAPATFCATAGDLEDFSSRGPTIDGTTKPDLAGPDGVTTSLGTFFGTSASAPHVAGAAALLQGVTGGCSPSLLHAMLTGDHVEAVGNPVPNNEFGFGRLLLADPPPSPNPVLRFAGANRFATAAAISQADFPCRALIVFVATGENFPDALAGAAVASRFNAPILLVRRDSIPAETAAELARLDPVDIVILGGEAAVSAQVESQLGASANVTRVAGPDRYATAAAISILAFPDPDEVTDVFVATGENFADALAGGPVGAFLDGPVLLTRQASLPQVTVDEILELGPERIWVLGGPAAVSNAVVAQLATIAPTQRIFGPDRYATAVAASSLAFVGPTLETGDATVHRVYVAVGTNFPDALAGGAVAGLRHGPVLLVQQNAIPQAVVDEILRLKPRQIVILGGTAVVSASVQAQLQALLGG